MGADFCYSMIPAAKWTDERVSKIKEIVAEWQPENEDAGYKELLMQELQDQFDPDGRRDTARLCIDNRQISYWISGGMTWGDEPTDAMPVFDAINACPRLYEQLAEWAREDLKTR